jgi:hypothetical protein
MAKAIIKGLDEAINKIHKDYKNAMKVAAQKATERAKNDLYENVVSCLLAYYDDYNPTSYDRTYSLIDSFVPYAKPVQEVDDELICVAGVEFDPARIYGAYVGSKQYGYTDGQWVIDNFLMGIHPRTNGSDIVGEGNYEAEKYQGEFVPAAEMQRYVDDYYKIFDKNFRREMSTQILKSIRK